jgi:tetratricopeptide (TPR) repeat protein
VGDRLIDVPVWVGRDELLGQLCDRLCDRTLKVLALIGQGGIGKTSLAAKLVESIGVDLGRGVVSADCPFDGVLLLETRGTGDLLADILAGLGLDAETLEPSQWVDAILAVLQRQSWLVVLDNLEDVLLPSDDERVGRAIVPAFGELLNGLVYRSHRSRLLLTSRELPRDLTEQRGRNLWVNPKLVRVEEVKGIDKKAGAELLRDFGVVDDAAKLEEIAVRVAGHVFVLTQLAAFAVSELDGRLYRYLQQHPELYTDDVSQILAVQFGRRTGAQQQLLKRMSLLRFLTEVRGLTFLRLYEDEWETDGRLVIMDGSPMPFGKVEQGETQDLIDELVGVSLVEKVLEPIGPVRQYRLHPVVTEFLQEQFSAELPTLFQRVHLFYQRSQQPMPREFVKLQQLLQAPILMAQHLGHQGEQQYLAIRLMSLVDSNMMAQMLEQAASIQGLDELGSLLQQGAIAYQFNNWDEAEIHYQNALMLAREQDDRAKTAQAIGQLGSIERNRGNWDEAERLYRQKLEMCEQLGDRQGISQVIRTIGSIESNRGNWDEAERLYRQCLEIEEELGDRSGMASSWGVLGSIERNRGNWDEAERLYRRSLEMSEELGDRSGIAWITSDRGSNELGRGNLDLAESLLQDALAQTRRIDMTDLNAETNWHLAQLYRAKNNPDRAQQHYAIAHQLFTQLGAAKDLEKIEQEWNAM